MMINQQEVNNFFDKMAPQWDARQKRDTKKIRTILYLAGIRNGIDVLDVACGTGVLIPDYLDMNVGSLTAIDISSQMISIARRKFPDINFLHGDAETYEFDKLFDAIVIYDASPHFPDIERLIKRLSGFLRPYGKLTIAHSMGPIKLDEHHSGDAKNVSLHALPVEELKDIFSRYLTVTAVVSDENMYQVTGMLRA